MKCKMCNEDTVFIVNIKFKVVPLCNSCADAISTQHLKFLISNRDKEE